MFTNDMHIMQAPLVGNSAPEFSATAVFDQEFMDITLSQYKVRNAEPGYDDGWSRGTLDHLILICCRVNMLYSSSIPWTSPLSVQQRSQLSATAMRNSRRSTLRYWEFLSTLNSRTSHGCKHRGMRVAWVISSTRWCLT